MKKSDAIRARDRRVISPSLTRELPLVFKRGKGCVIWDADGKRYLDFAASIAVNSVGHCNMDVRRAILKQLKDGIHCAFSDFYAEIPVRFSEKLLESMPDGFDKVFLSNSGTEATEAAYKLARWHTDKKWVIAFDGAFHGRTMGSLSLTKSKPVHRDRFGPFLPVMHTPFPYPYRMRMDPEECSDHCLSLLEERMRAVRDDLAAVFMEPIQGESGYVVPPTSFIRGARKLCNDYGALLGMDEVQSGCWRTGRFLAEENFGVKADIVWMAKALAGGVPIGATMASSRIMDWPPGSHANTFGGNLLACAAGIACLDFMRKKKLGENARKVGSYLMKRLKESKSPSIREVRGIGLMIGIEMPDKKTRDTLVNSACRKGLVLLPAGEAVFRISPPLILTMGQAAEGMEIIEDCLKRI